MLDISYYPEWQLQSRNNGANTVRPWDTDDLISDVPLRSDEDSIEYLPSESQEVFFQTHQFDKDLRRSSKPIGTDHVRRQGSETDDQEESFEVDRDGFHEEVPEVEDENTKTSE